MLSQFSFLGSSFPISLGTTQSQPTCLSGSGPRSPLSFSGSPDCPQSHIRGPRQATPRVPLHPAVQSPMEWRQSLPHPGPRGSCTEWREWARAFSENVLEGLLFPGTLGSKPDRPSDVPCHQHPCHGPSSPAGVEPGAASPGLPLAPGWADECKSLWCLHFRAGESGLAPS